MNIETQLKVSIAEAILLNRVFTVVRTSDRKVRPTPVRVRHMSEGEVRALAQGQTVPCILNNGRLGQVRITLVKTWVRKPDVEIHVKYGMYEFATLTLAEAMQKFVVVMSNS